MTSMMAKTRMPLKALPAGIGKVLKRLQAYSLSLRNLEEMMAERGH